MGNLGVISLSSYTEGWDPMIPCSNWYEKKAKVLRMILNTVLEGVAGRIFKIEGVKHWDLLSETRLYRVDLDL